MITTAWHVPLGEFEELTKLGVPPTGTPSAGEAITTAGNLVFIGATIDGYFRAFDARNGKELWRDKLPQPSQGSPVLWRARLHRSRMAGSGGCVGGASRLRATPSDVALGTTPAACYLTRAHGAVASKAYGDSDFVKSVLADWRTARLDPKLRAVLGLLETLTLSPETLSEQDFGPARQAGLTDDAIAEAIHVCAQFNIYARMADSLKFDLPDAAGFEKTADSLLSRGYRQGK